MNTQRLAGAIAGSLVAGIGLSALMIRGERKSGKPSELTEIGRAFLVRLGNEPEVSNVSTPGEQAITHTAHLALSALAGAVYATATDEKSNVLLSGTIFGLGFYVTAHWVAGPVLKLKQPEWYSDDKTIAMHTLNHLLFGLATAAGARLASATIADRTALVRSYAIGD